MTWRISPIPVPYLSAIDAAGIGAPTFSSDNRKGPCDYTGHSTRGC